MTAFSQTLAAQFGPYTLPNGDEPRILLDFKNGNYLVDGGMIEVSDIAHTSGGWAGDFNPADVDPGVGFVADDDNYTTNLSLIEGEAAYNLSLAPFTFLVDWIPGATADCSCGYRYRSSGEGSNKIRLVMSGPNGYDIAASFMDVAANGLANPGIHSLENDIFTDETLYRVAYTIDPDGIAYSVNGGAVVRHSVDEGSDAVLHDFEVSDLVVFFISGTGTVLEKFGVYPPQPDADLPSLSAL